MILTSTSKGTFFPWTKKVYTWGLPPIVSLRPRDPHVIPLHQSILWDDSLKHVALLVFHSFSTAQPSCSATMVQTLEKLVLTTVPLVVLLDLWKAVWHLPSKKICLSTLFKRSRTTELTNLSRTLPWDDPVARALDFEVHRRKMAGKSCRFFGWQGWGPFLPSYPFFSWIVAVFPDFDFRRQVPWPTHLCLCPRRCRLNWVARFWVPMCSCRFLTTLEDKPVCHIYQWLLAPPMVLCVIIVSAWWMATRWMIWFLGAGNDR